MSKESELRMARCEGKQAFTKVYADRVAKRSSNNLQPYKCEFCRKWHLGTPFNRLGLNKRTNDFKKDVD